MRQQSPSSQHLSYPQDVLSAAEASNDDVTKPVDSELEAPIQLSDKTPYSTPPSSSFSSPTPSPSRVRRVRSPQPSPEKRRLVSPVMTAVYEQAIPPVPPLPPNFLRKSLGVQEHRQQQRREEFELGTSPPLARRHSDPPLGASSPPAISVSPDDADAVASVAAHSHSAAGTPPPAPSAASSTPGLVSGRMAPPKSQQRIRRKPPPTHLFDGPVTPPEASYAPRAPLEGSNISLDDATPLPAPVDGALTIMPSASSLSVTTPKPSHWFDTSSRTPSAGSGVGVKDPSIGSRYSSYNGNDTGGKQADRGDRMDVMNRVEDRTKGDLPSASVNPVGVVGSELNAESGSSPVSPSVGADGDSVIHKRRSPPSLTSHSHTYHSGVSTSTINSLPPTPKTSRGVTVVYNELRKESPSPSWIASGGRYTNSMDQPRQSMDHTWPYPPHASDDGHVHAHHPCPDLSCSSNSDHEEVMLGSTEMSQEEMRDMQQFMAKAMVLEDEDWVDEEDIEEDEEDEDVAKRDHDPSWTWQRPSKRMVQKAAECTLFDEYGNKLKFGDLLPTSETEDEAEEVCASENGSRLSQIKTNETHQKSVKSVRSAGHSRTRVNELPRPPRSTRTVVFFVGHWWCGLCHDYVLMSLAKLSPAALLRAGVRVCVISSGTWKAITKYKEMFNIPPTFNVYVDRGIRLYKALGMRSRIPNPFSEMKLKFRAGYHRHAFLRQMATGMASGFFRITGFKNPGNFMQLGGEFVFSTDYTCDFAHRMTARSDHCEAPDVLKAVGVQEVSLGAPLHSQNSKVESMDTKVDATAAEEPKEEVEEFADDNAAPRGSNDSAPNEKTSLERPSTPTAVPTAVTA